MPAPTKEVPVMSEIDFQDEFDAPPDDEDPLGPFGNGPAIDDTDEAWVDPVYEGFGDDAAFGPIWSAEIDYCADDDGWPYPD